MSKRTTLAFRWGEMLTMLAAVLLYDGISRGRVLMSGYVNLISAHKRRECHDQKSLFEDRSVMPRHF